MRSPFFVTALFVVPIVFASLTGCASKVIVEAPRDGLRAARPVSSAAITNATTAADPVDDAVRTALIAQLAGDKRVQTSNLLGSPESTMQIGADLVANDETDSYVIEDRDGRKRRVYNATRTYTLSGNYRLIDLQGEIASNQFLVTDRETASSSNSGREALNALPAPQMKLPGLASRVADQVRQEAFPHIARREVELKGGSSTIKTGNEHLSFGQIESAEQMYEQALAAPGGKTKDRVAALYNLGVVAELRGQSGVARSYYNQVLSLQPGDSKTLANLRQLDIQDNPNSVDTRFDGGGNDPQTAGEFIEALLN